MKKSVGRRMHALSHDTELETTNDRRDGCKERQVNLAPFGRWVPSFLPWPHGRAGNCKSRHAPGNGKTANRSKIQSVSGTRAHCYDCRRFKAKQHVLYDPKGAGENVSGQRYVPTFLHCMRRSNTTVAWRGHVPSSYVSMEIQRDSTSCMENTTSLAPRRMETKYSYKRKK